MPRPDSGFLSGVLAGINQFKQTRQFYEQMESTNLQQEATRAQMAAFQRREQDYRSPQQVYDDEHEQYKRKLGAGAEAQLDLEGKLYGISKTRWSDEDDRAIKMLEKRFELQSQYNPNGRSAGAGAMGALKGTDAFKIANEMADRYLMDGDARNAFDESKVIEALMRGDWKLAKGILRVDQVLTGTDANKWMYTGQYQYAPEGLIGEKTKFYDLREYLDNVAANGAAPNQIQQIIDDAIQQMTAQESSRSGIQGPPIGKLSRDLMFERINAAGISGDDVTAYDFPSGDINIFSDIGKGIKTVGGMVPARDIYGDRSVDGANQATGAAQTFGRDWGRDRGYGIGVQVQYKGSPATILGAWPIKWDAGMPTEFELRLQLPDGKVVDSIPTSRVGG